LAEIVEESLLELVHADAAGRVRRVDAGDPVLDAALLDRLGHLVRDIPDGQPAHCPQVRLALKDLHSLPPRRLALGRHSADFVRPCHPSVEAPTPGGEGPAWIRTRDRRIMSPLL